MATKCRYLVLFGMPHNVEHGDVNVDRKIDFELKFQFPCVHGRQLVNCYNQDDPFLPGRRRQLSPGS